MSSIYGGEEGYLALLEETLWSPERADRTGVGTVNVFGKQLRFDLRKGFPLITTKRVHFKSVVHELLWFLSGSTNIKSLQENGVRIWNEWADENGDLGPVYGKQWRNFGGVDQITNLIKSLRKDPYSRRHLVTAWNPPELPSAALPPCHVMFQFFVTNNNELSCQVYQRSADLFLGVPFNIASYALLTHLVAKQVGLKPRLLSWIGGDCHVYLNHVNQSCEQLERELRVLPRLEVKDGVRNIFSYQPSDIKLIGYDPHPSIKGEVAV